MSFYENCDSWQLMSLSKAELVGKISKLEEIVQKKKEENNSFVKTFGYFEELINSSLKTENQEWVNQHNCLEKIEEEMKKRNKIDKSFKEVTEHDKKCNTEFDLEWDEVEASQEQFQWRVVDLFDSKKQWLSWDMMCPPPTQDHKISVDWMYGARLEHAFTGILRIKGGHSQPCHRHKLPEIYYILQGDPVVTLAGVPNRVRVWQCVSIPSYCPHTITNDGEREVIIAWCYISPHDKVNPHENYDWEWLPRSDSLPEDCRR